MPKKINKFFKLFENQYVSILTRMSLERQTSSGEIVEVVKTPISINGYLVDSDDKFYYLGHSPGVINQAIPQDDVAHIEIVHPDADVMEQLLLSEEIPTKDKFN